MEEFEVKGNDSFLRIKLEEVYGYPNTTCPWGGYDARISVEVSAYSFHVKAGNFYSSTGEIYNLYQKLFACNEILNGSVHFTNYEENLEFDIIYEFNGHILIQGKCRDNSGDNSFKFALNTDQSYIQSTLLQMWSIIEKYGDDKGV